jgi:hypothetical protein
MSPKEIYKSYMKKKYIFHEYLDKIKKNIEPDIFNIINPTLTKNTYSSSFPRNFFIKKKNFENEIFLFIKNSIKFFFKNIILLISYFISFLIYKLFYKKKRKNKLENLIDVFVLIDNINKDKKFNENYLKDVYEIFEKYNKNYSILPRLYPVSNNPFKLIKFFKIINKDKRDFVFEFEILSLIDFIIIFIMIVKYPFKALNLKQKNNNDLDKVFNHSLLEDLNCNNFSSFSRYALGIKLSKINTIKKIYSWCEFQTIERSFNYALRSNNNDLNLIGLQFYINYETYFSTNIDDLDYNNLTSPHLILVNGKYFILKRKKIKYQTGVSLRYKEIFSFKSTEKEKNVLLIGSYIVSDTNYLLNCSNKFSNLIFKNHPAVNIERLNKLPSNIKVSNKSVYKLFKSSNLVILTAASGVAAEAVSCGLSVIILASQNNLTANPLIEKGKGKIWDLAFNVDEIETIYKKLTKFRSLNKNEIMDIASWYRNNFFIEPTEQNILNTFEIVNNK